MRFDFDGHKLFYQFETTYRILADRPVNPVYMEISPVGNCNHRCLFCAYDYIGYQSRRLDTAKTLQALKDMGRLGVGAVLFAGEGEPLVHPDIDQMVHAAREGGMDIGMYTNGVLLNERRAEAMLGKMTFIRFSFNAGTKEAYKRVHQSDDFEKVCENIQRATHLKRSRGLEVDIGMQFVVIPENIDTMEEAARLGSELGVDYLAIKPFVQHPDQQGYSFPENFSLSDVEDKISAAERHGSDHYRVIGRRESFRKYHERTYEHCYALPLFGYMLSDGHIYSCGPFLGNPDYSYGSINDKSYEEILHSLERARIMEHARSTLNCKTECMPNCRMDAINRSLWELKHPSVKHVRFI